MTQITANEPPKCFLCEKPIETVVYRCMDCRMPFHRCCLFVHCGKASIEKGGEAYLDACMKGVE